MKTLLPTSTAGSLPKPSWLAQPETLWSPWKLQDDGLIEGKQDALRLALDDQRQAGIDIVSDGEQTRQHFVTTFIEHLDGVDFEARKTVRIRDRYDASVPTVVGAVTRPKPVFVEDARFLRQQTDRPIKWALPGPMTMIDTLYDDHYKSREKLAFEFAKILNEEAREDRWIRFNNILCLRRKSIQRFGVKNPVQMLHLFKFFTKIFKPFSNLARGGAFAR